MRNQISCRIVCTQSSNQGNESPLGSTHLGALGVPSQVSSRLGGCSGSRMSFVKTLIPLMKNGRISLISIEQRPESYARIRNEVSRKGGGRTPSSLWSNFVIPSRLLACLASRMSLRRVRILSGFSRSSDALSGVSLILISQQCTD
jgi:hypothetical protein